jgi:hypothetical protein
MKKYLGGLLAMLWAVAGATEETGQFGIYGKIACDQQKECHYIVAGGVAFPGVTVNLLDSGGGFLSSAIANTDGIYAFPLTTGGTYTVEIDQSTLPAGAALQVPSSGSYVVELSIGEIERRDFIVDDASCGDSGACWMTAGGVKFEVLMDGMAAEAGPKDSFGGNVYPSCSPEPGDGGQWNHIAHGAKLHFLGTSIRVVRCGNVTGIDPGSESPVTPFNFIEFEGEGTLSGIKGNKFPKTAVRFFARVEDHNEPGNENAADGEDVDRYFLRVYEGDGAGTTHLLVDVDGDPDTVDPLTITGGNLQLHFSSCEN